ncbi:hypothetical protein EVG20_g5000 [Dentipellis fragilis]|uniref:Uncharacterized protein n=1 Tax=Dentipellis fragilis TaxID=205917 RepID=A0A4Y9YY73_9AGAM|nr:hypothetical protein EVG20_g5000 [Dentipellis fragilis]
MTSSPSQTTVSPSVPSPFQFSKISMPGSLQVLGKDQSSDLAVPLPLVLAFAQARLADPDQEYTTVQGTWSFLPQKLRPTNYTQHAAMEGVVQTMTRDELCKSAVEELRGEIELPDVYSVARLQNKVRQLIDALYLEQLTICKQEQVSSQRAGFSKQDELRVPIMVYCRYLECKEQFKREWDPRPRTEFISRSNTPRRAEPTLSDSESLYRA